MLLQILAHIDVSPWPPVRELVACDSWVVSMPLQILASTDDHPGRRCVSRWVARQPDRSTRNRRIDTTGASSLGAAAEVSSVDLVRWGIDTTRASSLAVGSRARSRRRIVVGPAPPPPPSQTLLPA